jgi:hypothetical protein
MKSDIRDPHKLVGDIWRSRRSPHSPRTQPDYILASGQSPRYSAPLTPDEGRKLQLPQFPARIRAPMVYYARRCTFRPCYGYPLKDSNSLLMTGFSKSLETLRPSLQLRKLSEDTEE